MTIVFVTIEVAPTPPTPLVPERGAPNKLEVERGLLNERRLPTPGRVPQPAASSGSPTLGQLALL
jgi:hypothetical protein